MAGAAGQPHAQGAGRRRAPARQPASSSAAATRSPAGCVVYDLADPFDPQQIGWLDLGGKGFHRIVWTGGRYAHASAIPEGFDDRIWVTIDMSDPSTRSRPGAVVVAAARCPRASATRPTTPCSTATRAYLGYGDAGMVVLDVSDMAAPQQIGHLGWEPGGDTHTCLPLPGRKLVVVTDEALADRCDEEPEARARARRRRPDGAARRSATARCPRATSASAGSASARTTCTRTAPGSYRSERIVFVTYFNAGLRVFDLADPEAPGEIAHWVPETPPGQEDAQTNDLFVDADGLVWVTDRIGGGLVRARAGRGAARAIAEAAL